MKKHIDPEKLAAWIWYGNDDPALERLLNSATKKASAIELGALGDPYPRVRDDSPASFNERACHTWIESVSDPQDRVTLGRLIKTMKLSLEIDQNQLEFVNDDIEFIDPGGSGLKGNIYKARQKSLLRTVAVKFIKPEWGGDALKHAQMMARIDAHENVVS